MPWALSIPVGRELWISSCVEQEPDAFSVGDVITSDRGDTPCFKVLHYFYRYDGVCDGLLVEVVAPTPDARQELIGFEDAPWGRIYLV